MKTIIHVVGARPNFIKAAPLIAEIEKSWNVENLRILNCVFSNSFGVRN